MPSHMHIMPELGLSYLRYSGHLTIPEISTSLAACTDHPAFKSHFRHIADLSDITGFDPDYLGIMKAQAQVAGMFRGDVNASHCVFLAPTPVAQSLSTIVARSWEGANDPIMLILPEAAQVESNLGLRPGAIAQMRDAAQPVSLINTDNRKG